MFLCYNYDEWVLGEAPKRNLKRLYFTWEEQSMSDKTFLAETMARFDFLKDQIKENLHSEDARKELLDDIDDFLEAGCDPNTLAQLIGPMGRYRNFHKLTAYGARIDIRKIARSMAMNKFVWKNLEGFVERGADINWLLVIFRPEYIYAQEDFYYNPKVGEKSIQRLFNLKADPEKVFELFEGWLLGLLSSDIFFDELDLFVKNGLDTHFVKRWLEEQLKENRGELLERLFSDYGCDYAFQKYGISASDYVSRYVSEYGKYPSGYDFAEYYEEEGE